MSLETIREFSYLSYVFQVLQDHVNFSEVHQYIILDDEFEVMFSLGFGT